MSAGRRCACTLQCACVVRLSRVVTSPTTYLRTTPPTALLLGSRRRRSTSKWIFPYPRRRALQLTGILMLVKSMLRFHPQLFRYRLRVSVFCIIFNNSANSEDRPFQLCYFVAELCFDSTIDGQQR